MIGGSSLTRQLYSDLQELKKLFEYNPAWFNEWEKGFVKDSLQRFHEYGYKAFFNQSQEKKIDIILGKVRSKL